MVTAPRRSASFASRARRWSVASTPNLSYNLARCCLIAASETTRAAAISRIEAGSVKRSRSSSGRQSKTRTSCSRAVMLGLSTGALVTVRPISAESRKSSFVDPTRTSSPWRSLRAAKMRSPFTYVPFDEPRWVTHHPAGNRSNTAWRRLTVSSSSSARSFSSPLPMVTRSPGSTTVRRPAIAQTSTAALMALSVREPRVSYPRSAGSGVATRS